MAELTLSELKRYVEEKLADTDCFPVDINIKGIDIQVEIDSDSRVDIDFVAALSREIEAHFAPEIDDYNLEVGSYGLTSPLVLPRQFRKNLGNDVDVLGADGKKYHGMLKQADDDGFTIAYEEKVKKEGAKRPVVESVERTFAYPEAKIVTYALRF